MYVHLKIIIIVTGAKLAQTENIQIIAANCECQKGYMVFYLSKWGKQIELTQKVQTSQVGMLGCKTSCGL